jgi:hypothetical protein
VNVSTLLVSVLLVVSTASAHANAGKLAQIRSQQEEIRKESERSTGKYVRFEETEMQKLRSAQARVFALLNGVSDLDQLNSSQQAELFNALETVKAVIAANDADRQECWREKRLGSQRFETHCATVREREQLREGARDFQSDPAICSSGASSASCGGG